MKERKIFEAIKNLNQILLEINPEKDVLLSIVDLKLPQKSGKLKIWLSIFPEGKSELVINYLRKNQDKIKNRIKKIGFRYLPQKIEFYPSNAFQEAGELINVLEALQHEIKKQEEKN